MTNELLNMLNREQGALILYMETLKLNSVWYDIAIARIKDIESIKLTAAPLKDAEPESHIRCIDLNTGQGYDSLLSASKHLQIDIEALKADIRFEFYKYNIKPLKNFHYL